MKPIGIKKTESTDFLDMKMFKLNMRHANSGSIVKELIENGYSSVKTNHALQYAALYNQNDIIKYLVDKGADIDACNGYALNEVTQSGNIEMVKYLVEHGADPWKSHDGYLPIAVVISMISGGCYGGMSKKSYKEIIEYFDSIRSDGYRIIHEKMI